MRLEVLRDGTFDRVPAADLLGTDQRVGGMARSCDLVTTDGPTDPTDRAAAEVLAERGLIRACVARGILSRPLRGRPYRRRA